MPHLMRLKHALVESMSETNLPELFGGVACLDFANTLDGRATMHPEEYLHTYADLVSWDEYAAVIDPATAALLAATAPAAADAALRAALDLRESIFHVFSAIGRGGPASAAALAAVQGRYAEAMAAARLAPAGAGYDWQFSSDDAPDHAWWPLAVSATRLITTGPLDRVKVCAAEAGCIGLFLDTSKNRSRRWCTMDGCGVEAKVQRQAKRRRTARATG
jgi:predicted RNA-binding Zn ribbon-like protein